MRGSAPAWTLPNELSCDDPRPGAALLRTYFHSREDDGQPSYTGAMFEAFAGGGDSIEMANMFTADDIVAVSLLSVDVPGAATLRMLGPRASALNGLLCQIPVDLELHEARDQDISDGSAADQLWRMIRAAGVGPVTTSKLLARKRPSCCR